MLDLLDLHDTQLTQTDSKNRPANITWFTQRTPYLFKALGAHYYHIFPRSVL